MAKMSKMEMFEKSGKDVEPKGMKEGSKADMALVKKQMKGMKFAAGGGVTSSAVSNRFKADLIPDQKSDEKAVAKAGLPMSTKMPTKFQGKDTGLKRASTALKGGTSAAPAGYAKGGMIVIKGSAPAARTVREADGIAQRGKTRGQQFAQKK